MNRCYPLAALVCFSFTSALLCAAPAPISTDRIESLQLQYLGAKTAEQRKHVIGEFKTMVKDPANVDAAALNAAVAAMLPEAETTWEAETLLAIGAATPACPARDNPSLAGDSEFLVDARQALREAGSAHAEIESLADIRVDHLQRDGEGRAALALTHVQQLWKINSESGARSFSPRTVVYSGMSESLCQLQARVLKRDGSEEKAAVSADRPIVDGDSSMYFDARSRQLRFPHLQPGDFVEIEYLLLPSAQANSWAGYYARIEQFKATSPIRLQRRVLIAPSTIKVYSASRGLRSMEVQRGGNSIRIWEARGHQRNSPEFASAEEGGSQPYLHVSTFGSVHDFGRWYSQLLAPALELDQNLQNIAQKISARNLTTEGKVQAVYESVKRLTKYTGFEFGVHSFQPYPVSTVERRGFGDCKDKAAMLVALLRAVGVKAEFTMIRTRAAGEIADGVYSAQQFDHAIVYVPELNLYLDGTADSLVPGALPSSDLGAMAVTVDAQGGATLRTVLAASPQRMQADSRGDQDAASNRNPGTSIATQQRADSNH